ncbi:hypothetical protein DR864_26675 [Runella rosea]|uniref:WD40-like Beta Propeller Repeat n=1 Tax=Runella rosea TaxID=2259595 RepID=A0A344TQZ4_9BACT|nr:nuclear transport factor 2 family protein [Runella rosea]AXE21065.1 hypothetical protein DR864_26675 [Runella rosea]
MKTPLLLLITLFFSFLSIYAQKTDRQLAEETLRNYMDGGTYGDTVKMMAVFHPTATMKFVDKKTGTFRDVPIAQYLDSVRRNAGVKSNRQTRIVYLDIIGTAAHAKLELDYPTFQFIDFFNLLKTDGQWKVVSKIFYRLDKAPLLAKDTISTNDVFGFALAPGEQQAYFVKSYGGRDSLHLFETQKKNGQWTIPQKASFSGKYKDIDPAFSPSGNVLIFNSNRPTTTSDKNLDFNIWGIRKQSQGWSEPFSLGTVVNSDSSDFYATLAANGNLYFTSLRLGGLGGTDIWRSVFKNGVYQKPENLGSIINSQKGESNPFISPDEKYLIFLSDTEGGLGDSDLYISFQQNGQWSIPQNLGPDINTPLAEFAPSLSPDGKTLFFGRIKRGKPQVENIYYVNDFDKIVAQFLK